MNCEKQLTLIPGATHLFEEPGTLQQAAKSAAGWFVKHFQADI
jgi:putative phosphoribosyl transferase